MSTQLEIGPDQTLEVGFVNQPDDDAAEKAPFKWTAWHLFWLGLLVATLPMMIVYFMRMWSQPQYQYFPFAIAAVAYLAYSRSDKFVPPPASVVSIGILIGSLIFFAASLFFNSPWFGAISFVLLATSLLYVMRGPRDTTLFALCLPLVLLIRLPLGYDGQLVTALQRVTTQLSSLLLDMVGIPHAVARNTIQLAERELFVAEACSGVQSVFTLAFLTTLLIVIYRRRLWLAPFYLAIALMLAVAGNVLRVSAVAAGDVWLGIDLAEGWQHDVLGYVTLGIAALFLLSFDRLIISFLHPISSAGASGNPIVSVWNSLLDDGQSYDVREDYLTSGKASKGRSRSKLNPWLMRKFSGLDQRPVRLGIVSLSVVGLLAASVLAFPRNMDVFFASSQIEYFIDKLFINPTEDFFDPVADDFELVDYENARGGENPILGKNADLWKYSRTLPSGQTLLGQVVISQAYGGWHDLAYCYAGLDWKENVRRHLDGNFDITAAASEEVGKTFEYVQFGKPSGEIGYLWFGGIDSTGELYDSPGSTNRLSNRLTFAMDEMPIAEGGLAILQLWIVNGEKLSNKDTEAIARDFQAMRVHLAAAIAKQHKSGDDVQ